MEAKRDYVSKAFSFGDEPIWQQFAYADVFLDAFVDPQARASLKDPNGFRNMVGSLEMFSKALVQLQGNATLGKYKHHVAQVPLLPHLPAFPETA